MDETTLTKVIGIAAGAFTAISLLPQIVKVIKEKKSQDISIFYLFVLLTGLILWTIYGFRKDDFPIIATNIGSMVLNIAMIVLGMIYKKKDI